MRCRELPTCMSGDGNDLGTFVGDVVGRLSRALSGNEQDTLAPLAPSEAKSAEVTAPRSNSVAGFFVKQRGISQSGNPPALQARGGSAVGQVFAAELGGEVPSAAAIGSAPIGTAPISSIRKLGERYDELGQFGALLPQVLHDSIEPPTFLLIGKSSAGKSSLLERLTMLPLFPRSDSLCTRAVVQIRLRRVPQIGIPCTIAVVDTSDFFEEPARVGAPRSVETIGVLSDDGTEV